MDAEDEAAAFTAGVRVFGTEFLVLSLGAGVVFVKFTDWFGTGGMVVVLAGVCPGCVFMRVLFAPATGI